MNKAQTAVAFIAFTAGAPSIWPPNQGNKMIGSMGKYHQIGLLCANESTRRPALWRRNILSAYSLPPAIAAGIAQLSAIDMSKYQMITSVVLVSIYFPCVATFVMLLKEGWKNLLGSLAVLVAVIFLYGGLINLIWTLLGVQ